MKPVARRSCVPVAASLRDTDFESWKDIGYGTFDAGQATSAS